MSGLLHHGWRIPIGSNAKPRFRPLKNGRRRYLTHILIDGAIVCEKARDHELSYTVFVEFVCEPGACEGSSCRGERDSAASYRVDKRLDTEAIANQVELTSAIIPEAECEHATQPAGESIDAPVHVAMQKNLCIGLADEFVAIRSQLVA